jgi:dTMP kinase
MEVLPMFGSNADPAPFSGPARKRSDQDATEAEHVTEQAGREGVLLTIDGPGGVGKSSTVAEAAAYLRKIGVPVHSTSQPSAGTLGSYVRAAADIYRGMALACLVAGDRHHQQATEIEPALAAGHVVLCDRYVPSSLVLQVLDGVTPETVWALNAGVRVPDAAVILRADSSVIHSRMLGRGPHNRFERGPDSARRELELFDAVADDLRAKGWPVHVFDCTNLLPCETALNIANLIVPLLDLETIAAENEGTHA